MRAFVEGFGCSLNKADTQAIKGLLLEKGIQECRLEELEKGGLAVINTCAVKETTEKRMLSRIEKVWKIAERKKFKLVVFGCLAKAMPEKVRKISEEIAIIPPALEELSEFLGSEKKEFSPGNLRISEGITAIIPVCRGCLGECTYCIVKKARGNLKSYAVKELKKAFEKEIKNGKREVWLTAQDCGCYGFDIKTNLAELLKELLKIEGNYRIRVGMMNVQHLKKFLPELLEEMHDERVYKFLHIPLQSGNNRILELMNRNYTIEEWLETAEKARKEFPEITIATDIIAGFPAETEKEFEETLQALKKAKVDVVNISRFGKRSGTKAALMKEVLSKVKKDRSRKAARFYEKLAKERNERMVGKIEEVLVCEKGKQGTMVARASNYKPVVLENAKLGDFAKANVLKAEKTFLKGKITKQ